MFFLDIAECCQIDIIATGLSQSQKCSNVCVGVMQE